MAVWCCLWSFGIFFPFWHVWAKNNLATLLGHTLKRIEIWTELTKENFLLGTAPPPYTHKMIITRRV
jgi:hypothetical protein